MNLFKLAPNLDSNGRKWRFAIALLLLIYAVWARSWLALAVSLFTFIEFYFSWCLFFQLIGRNDCPVNLPKKKDEEIEK